MKTHKNGKHRECVQTGKICFKNFEKAHVRIGKIITEDPAAALKNWSAYRCKFCEKVHISSGERKTKGIPQQTLSRKLRLNR